jgi:nucleotidyltransferase/DNA polymerase involved in DNA repair
LYSLFLQVEEVRNPALRGKPLGVTQKYLIVTSNYEARRLGVTKLMGIQEAKEKVPKLTLVCHSNTDQASEQIPTTELIMQKGSMELQNIQQITCISKRSK